MPSTAHDKQRQLFHIFCLEAPKNMKKYVSSNWHCTHIFIAVSELRERNFEQRKKQFCLPRIADPSTLLNLSSKNAILNKLKKHLFGPQNRGPLYIAGSEVRSSNVEKTKHHANSKKQKNETLKKPPIQQCEKVKFHFSTLLVLRSEPAM